MNDEKMADTEFTFRVGLVLGQVLATQPKSTIPTLAPGQCVIQMWSEPDFYGYRHLLTFEAKRTDTSG